MKHFDNARNLTLALICATTLGACSKSLESISGNPGENVGNFSQSQTVGNSLVDELSASSTSITASDAVSQNAGVSLTSSEVGIFSAKVPPACVSVVPNPVVDTDNDGVPDSATYTFNCNKTRVTGGTSSLTGSATLNDPGTGFNLSVTELKSEFKNADGSLSSSSIRNGTRSVTGSSTQLSLNNSLTVARTSSDGSASIANSLSLSFTADSGSSITQGQPLPSGTIAATGNYGWVRGSENYSFQVTTPTALRYDASCSSEFKITSGVLRATLQGTGANGFVRLTFNGCGVAPSVIFLKN